MENLTFVPFGYIKNAKTNTSTIHRWRIIDTYIKNAFIALLSLKNNNKNSDIALGTNYHLKQSYIKKFNSCGIKIINCEFNFFRFPNNYPWCLAYYKLCALQYVSNLNYKNYLMLDSDIFCKESVEAIFDITKDDIVLYRHKYKTIPSLPSLKDKYVSELINGKVYRCVGGIFACSSNNVHKFLKTCNFIFETTLKENYFTKAGDEFITSNAAAMIENIYDDGDKFIQICWTRAYRRIPDEATLSSVPILHVFTEKNDGMLKIYNYYLKHKTLPSDKNALKFLHIYDIAFINKLKRIIIKILHIQYPYDF